MNITTTEKFIAVKETGKTQTELSTGFLNSTEKFI